MNTKIINASLRTKQNVPCGSNHSVYMDEFCFQLQSEHVIIDLATCISLGTVDILIHDFAAIKVISNVLGIALNDRLEVQRFADHFGVKCILISFGTDSEKPQIEYLYPS